MLESKWRERTRIFALVFATILLGVSGDALAKPSKKCLGQVASLFSSSPTDAAALAAELEKILRAAPEGVARKLAKKFAGRMASQKVSEADILKTTLKYYGALQSPGLLRFYRNFSYADTERTSLMAGEVEKRLRQALVAKRIPINEGTIAKLRLLALNHRAHWSWAHFLASHATLNVFALKTGGEPFLMPFYLPKFSSPRFAYQSAKDVRVRYYERVLNGALSMFYAYCLAELALNPKATIEELRGIFEVIREDAPNAPAAAETIVVPQGSEELTTKANEIAAEIDALYEATHGEKSNDSGGKRER